MIAHQRDRLFQHRLRDHLLSASRDHELISIIDCSFYRTKESCRMMQSPSSTWNLEQGIQSTDTDFQNLRNHLHRLRCEVSSRLMQEDLTGWQLIRAFDEMWGDRSLTRLIECFDSRPNVIETASMSNLNMCDDQFIEQLVRITRDRITEPLYRCTSLSNKSHQRLSSIAVSENSWRVRAMHVCSSSHQFHRDLR